ncbi:MAG: S16 family serine protease [Candidatus Micrarchaeota archaeon]
MNKLFVIFGILAFILNIVAATTSLEVPAVDAEGQGILSTISVTATSGTGDVFMSITPLTGIDTQHSEKTAVALAAGIAKVDKDKFNVLFKIESSAEVVDGPSAGAALTLLTYAEFSGKNMRSDASITGTIDKEGKVGKIGGVFEKTKAVGESKFKTYKLFLIPRGQLIQDGVDIAKYAKEKWQLQVVEVDNIDDAINYAFNTAQGSEVIVKQRIVPALNLIEFKTSAKTDPFKPIAQNEIQEGGNRLKTAKISEQAKVQVEETLKLAEKLLSNNYYYSAANTAFLATITLDELSYANGSKRELRTRLKELQDQTDGFNFTKQTQDNFEWVVGGKLRYHWAKEKISSAEDKIAIGNLVSAAGDLALASSWMRAAVQMNKIASDNMGGKEMKDIYYRDFASKIIEDAKELQADGLLDGEAEDHLNTAIGAFREADYLAAAFDASFATAYSEAFDMIGEKGYGEIAGILCKTQSFGVGCDVFKPLEFKTIWGELYYAHATYSFQESNRTRDSATLVNGLKLMKLSAEFEKRKDEVLAILRNPPEIAPSNDTEAGLPSPSKEVKIEVVAVAEDSSKNLLLYSIAGIAVLMALYIFVIRRPAETSITAMPRNGSKLERAEEMLLTGKMSDRSFEYFKEKYGKKGKEIKVKGKAK